MKRAIIIAVALSLLLAACADHRPGSIVASMPLVNAPPAKYKGALSVGEITGGSTDFPLLGTEGISSAQFREVLEKALAANGMLNQPATAATYKIDANVDPELPSVPWGDDNFIKEHVHYRIINRGDNSVLYDQVITTAAPGPVLSLKAVLFSTPAQVSQERRSAFNKAVGDNVVQFMGSLKQ